MRQRADRTDRAGFPPSAFSPPQGGTGTPYAGTPAAVGRCPLRPPAGSGSRGFTLLEVLIVIGIIGLLVAIAIPASTALVNNSRRTNTEALMKTIEGAIDAFRRDKPLTGYVFPPDCFTTTQTEIATAKEDYTDSNSNGRWDSNETILRDDGDQRFCGNHIRETIKGLSPKSSFDPVDPSLADEPRDAIGPEPWHSGDYRSIETLHLYISQLSPAGKQILQQLPASSITNQDLCRGATCADHLVFDTNGNGDNNRPYNTPNRDKAVDLFEIRDPWGQPLRYDVRQAKGAPRGVWELRSGGPDGRFTGMFSEKDVSGDDVFMRGE